MVEGVTLKKIRLSGLIYLHKEHHGSALCILTSVSSDHIQTSTIK